MANELFPSATERIDETFELTKPTFDRLIRRMRQLTERHNFHASAFTAEMLSVERDLTLPTDFESQTTVGRRWQFQLQPNTSRENRYEVTTYNDIGQEHLI